MPKTTKPKATTPPAKTTADWASEYGVQAALVNSNTELKTLFNQAVTGKWTPAKFQATFQNTTWYKTHADTWRVAETARLTDPASWKEQINQAKTQIAQQSSALGFTLSDDQVERLATQSLYLAAGSASNIDQTSLKTHLMETGRITGQGGQVMTNIDALKNNAYNYGLHYSDQWFTDASKAILSGTGATGNQQYWVDQMRNDAKSQFPSLAAQIDAGADSRTAADGYISKMASTLEIDPKSINMQDPLLRKALTSTTDSSGNVTPTPLWQFDQDLKKDDRYFKTNQAHQDMLGLSSQIARNFGMV
jgi:hypothetical protein